MDSEFLMECLRRLRRRRKISLRQSLLCLELCAAAPGMSFACAGDLPQISHGFHPGKLHMKILDPLDISMIFREF